MGCDIHLHVERKVAGKWQSVEPIGADGDVRYEDRWYKNRNYDLFAILADVRHGTGEAGAVTGKGFTPIAAPRGLPSDCDPRIAASSEFWGVDGHSHSYFTLAELLAYDWTQVTTSYGVVSALGYMDWSGYRKGRGLGPESYSGDVSGGAVKKILETDMVKALSAINQRFETWQARKQTIETELDHVYTHVSWVVAYHRAASDFWSELIPRLTSLAVREQLTHPDVRIVFWFDN